MSITCGAYDAAKLVLLVLLVAYRDSRRSKIQRILRDQFHWLARFVFLNLCSALLGVVGERLGTVWFVLECFVSVWNCLGTIRSVLGASRASLELTSYYVYSWGGFRSKLHPITYIRGIVSFLFFIILRLFVGWKQIPLE